MIPCRDATGGVAVQVRMRNIHWREVLQHGGQAGGVGNKYVTIINRV